MNKLPSGVFFGYGLLALPLTLVAMTFYIYVPKFYSDVIGIDLAIISNIMLFSRTFDAVIDPVIGNFSDRTRSRWGRRRPWIMLGALPLGICFIFLLAPDFRPASMSPETWYAGWTVVFFLFWTIVQIPYESFGAEISTDFNERTKLLGFREGFLVLGTLLSAIIPVVIGLDALGPESAGKFLGIGIFYAVLLLALAFWCVFRIKERQWEEHQRSTDGLFKSMRYVLRNKPFRILLISYTIGAFGGGLPATLIIYYVPYVLGSQNSSVFLCIYFVIGFVFLPAWIKLSAKIGKKESWVLAMLINTGAFFGVLCLGHGDETLYGILVALSAIGFGATLAIPSSMQADVIDYDEMLNGTRKEGQFIGLWYICKKLAAALGGAVAFRVLAETGYTPNAVQSPETILALKILYAGVPCICNFIAIAIAWKYPIDRAMYAKIREALDAKAKPGKSV